MIPGPLQPEFFFLLGGCFWGLNLAHQVRKVSAFFPY